MPPTPDEPSDREDAPFLSSGGGTHSNHHDGNESDIGIDGSGSKHASRSAAAAASEAIRFRLTMVLFLMVLTLEIGMIMTAGPLTRLYESVACRNYYLQHDSGKIGANGQVKEELCKVNDVQAEVAAVVGYREFYDGLLSGFLAIPYGLLADRLGRKPTVCLNIPGVFVNGIIVYIPLLFPDVVPLWTVWLSALAWFIGGGPVMIFATLWTMLADVTSEEERASVFFKFGVAAFGAESFASLISSWLMALNPWIPAVIGFCIVMLGMLLALTLPETKHFRVSQPKEELTVELAELSPDDASLMEHSHQKEERASDDSRFLENAHVESLEFTDAKATNQQSFFTKLHSRCRPYLTPYIFIFQNKRILLLLTAFFVSRLSRGSSFLAQYISTRYTWSLAQATFLVSFKPALSVPLFLYIIPSMSRYLLRYMKPDAKDLQLARLSVLLLVVGTLGIALAPSIAILIPSLILQTGGSGFVYLIRSLIATLVGKEEMARLFTAIEILQAAGNVVSSLTITTVFQAGLKMGGPWVGLAWMVTSILFAVVGVAMWKFELPPARRN